MLYSPATNHHHRKLLSSSSHSTIKAQMVPCLCGDSSRTIQLTSHTQLGRSLAMLLRVVFLHDPSRGCIRERGWSIFFFEIPTHHPPPYNCAYAYTVTKMPPRLPWESMRVSVKRVYLSKNQLATLPSDLAGSWHTHRTDTARISRAICGTTVRSQSPRWSLVLSSDTSACLSSAPHC
jgi:hypothetical protein